MKKFSVAAILAMLGLFFVPGCDDPAAYSAAAQLGGEALSMSIVQLKHPTQAQVVQLQVVVNQIDTCLKSYAGGPGQFAAAAPSILAAVDPAIKNDPVLMDIVNAMVPLACSQLDLVFSKHADWVAKGISSATLVDAFCAGVNAGLPVYVAKVTAVAPSK